MNNFGKTIGAIVFIIFAYFFTHPGDASSLTSSTVTHRVNYRVTGASNFSLTYATESGGTAQISSVKETWNEQFQAQPGQFLYVSVQNGVGYGSVQCEILIDGTVVKVTKSDGAYVIATCSTST